jgi:hypothetical protein
VAAVGCGGDDTSVGGEDAQGDVTPDQTSSADAKPDHKTDANDKDAKETDAKDKDVNSSDVVTDSDASNISPALLAFPNKVNTTYCLRIAECCGFDGGAGFNVAGCVHDVASVGGALANIGAAQVDSGNIALDETSAQDCLSDIASFNCDTLQDPLWANSLTACSTALQGQVGVNAGQCTSYWDCTAGSYCLNAADGGPGHCVTLSPEGGACSDFVNSTDCSYKGVGDPPQYCAQVGVSDSGVCTPALPLSAGCNANQWCATQICDPGTATTLLGACQNSTLFVGPPDSSTSLCPLFPFPDAGTD